MTDEEKKSSLEKNAIKEAVTEWLNDKFGDFDLTLGKYVRRIITAILFSLLVHSIITFRYSELRQIIVTQFMQQQ